MSEDQTPENGLRRRRARCTAFPLDNVCVASDPCPVHGCDDTNDGSTAQGCYCDPERVVAMEDVCPPESPGNDARVVAEAVVYDTLMDDRGEAEDADSFDLARRIVAGLIESGACVIPSGKIEGDHPVSEDQTPENDAPGAWLVYDYDHGPYAISLHDSAPAAARASARQGYGKVGFWPFGMELREAVDQWEGRVIPPGKIEGDHP